MATTEKQGEGLPKNPAGVYRHKETGQEIIAIEDPKYGNPQADAFVRIGFEFVRAAEGKELLNVPTLPQPVTFDPNAKSVAELEAELAAAKEREATRKEVMTDTKTETSAVVETPAKKTPATAEDKK